MHVVLTGATGLIGSAVLPQLVARGDRVTALVRSEEARRTVEAAGATGALIDFGDVSAIAEAFAQGDAVIHLAAAGDDAEGFDRRVADAAVQALGGTGKPYVHTGGVWVYGSGDDLTEEHLYSAPAITAWRLGVIASLEAADLVLTVLHPGIVYGDGGAGIPQVLAGQPRGDGGALTTLGSGRQHWTTVHVDDLAALYVAVVSDGSAHGGVLGVSGVNPTVGEMSAALAGGAGVVAGDPEAAKASLGDGFAEALLLDQQASGAKARSIGGWAPTRPTLLEELAR
ncbi:NAD-dependent epimerase/dehydratase family protein [Amnibacterium sp.]|uniref:NAD-dependent epimerase/dehydratase family protein n=1 Tax=Amnibacterium sp. TaxID=1872496 RepID=UPI003F7B7DE3